MEDEFKARKVTSGKLRDKVRTKNKMVQAVGKVLLKKRLYWLKRYICSKRSWR